MNIKLITIVVFLLNFQLSGAQAAGMEAGSWGGKVRSGPGKEFAKIGSLSNGDPVILIESTNIFLDGYEWFKIIYGNNSIGYQWGGILCGFDIPISGTYSVCEFDKRNSSNQDRTMNYRWVKSKNGIVQLSKMIQGGQNRKNVPLYLCRAEFKGGIHPGKLNLKRHKGCHISWGGTEHEISSHYNWEYAISELTTPQNQNWQPANGGSIPSGALRTGREAIIGNEVPFSLYTCRAKMNGGTHPGKVRPEFGGCKIPYGGKEHTVYQYEVLIN